MACRRSRSGRRKVESAWLERRNLRSAARSWLWVRVVDTSDLPALCKAALQDTSPGNYRRLGPVKCGSNDDGRPSSGLEFKELPVVSGGPLRVAILAHPRTSAHRLRSIAAAAVIGRRDTGPHSGRRSPATRTVCRASARRSGAAVRAPRRPTATVSLAFPEVAMLRRNHLINVASTLLQGPNRKGRCPSKRRDVDRRQNFLRVPDSLTGHHQRLPGTS